MNVQLKSGGVKSEEAKLEGLGVRVLTAIVLVGVVAACEYFAVHHRQYAFLFPAVALVMVALCAYEYARLNSQATAIDFDRSAGLVTTLFPPMLLTLRMIDTEKRDLFLGTPTLMAFGVIGSVFAVFFTGVAGRTSLEDAKAIGLKVFIGSFIGLGSAALIHLCFLPTHEFLFWMIAVVVANDTIAYFIGSLLGRNKLSASISPGKTIEGTIAGIIGGVVVGVLLSNMIGTWTKESIGLALCVSVVAQLFDLAKSLMKRIAQVKDSGTLLPGHGGFLDRLDGILGGALAVHIFTALII